MAGVAALSALACDRLPERLSPDGSKPISSRHGPSTDCYAHRILVFRTTPVAAERWAKLTDLPCVDAHTPCRKWSTSARTSSFWPARSGEPNGLDTLDASLAGDELTVDWGDYTCSGPFNALQPSAG